MTAAPAPTWGYLARRGLPAFTADGIVPIVAFYAAWHLWGLAAGIVLATALSAAVLLWRRGPLAWVTLVFVLVQGLVGLAAHSATVYLAQPVVLSAAWGVAYVVSALVGRPLIGLFAQAWYPFPPEFRSSDAFRREFSMQSLVWGAFCLARAGLRLVALLGYGVGGFLVVSLLTGTPFFCALIAWSLWHARRAFSTLDP